MSEELGKGFCIFILHVIVIGLILHCYFCFSDPWTRSRKMSAGSRNSSDRDQNESPNTCETTKSPPSKKVPKSKIKNKPSFNSYYDSGIVPDSCDYHGTIGRHQAGEVNNAFELDTTPAGVTGHISDDGRFKARPGLNRKRISFKDEVEAKQMAGVLPKGDKVAEPVSGVSDTSNTQRPATSFDPPTNQDEVNDAKNGLLDALNQRTSEAASCLGIGSSNEKRKRKYGYSSGSYNSASNVFLILFRESTFCVFFNQSLDNKVLPVFFWFAVFVLRVWRGQVCQRLETDYSQLSL